MSDRTVTSVSVASIQRAADALKKEVAGALPKDAGPQTPFTRETVESWMETERSKHPELGERGRLQKFLQSIDAFAFSDLPEQSRHMADAMHAGIFLHHDPQADFGMTYDSTLGDMNAFVDETVNDLVKNDDAGGDGKISNDELFRFFRDHRHRHRPNPMGALASNLFELAPSYETKR